MSYRRNTKLKLENEVKANRLNTIYSLLEEYEKYEINGVNETEETNLKLISKRDEENIAQPLPQYIECRHMLSGNLITSIIYSLIK